MTSLAVQETTLTRTSLTLSNINQAITFVNNQLQNLQSVLANFGEATRDLEHVRAQYEEFSGQDPVGHVIAHNGTLNEWCDYITPLSDLDTLENIERWTRSPEFLETTKRQTTRVADEVGVLTKCELNQWKLDYTQAHRANVILFDFAANMRAYSLQWLSPTIAASISSLRGSMAAAYNANIAQLNEMIRTTTAIRCAGALPITCLALQHPSHGPGSAAPENTTPESVTRMPCAPNECTCANGKGFVGAGCDQDGHMACESCEI